MNSVTRRWMHTAAFLFAFAGAFVLWAVPASANYVTRDGRTVAWEGGNRISVYDRSGNKVWSGEGVRNEVGRLQPPESANTGIRAPDRYNESRPRNPGYDRYWGDVPIYRGNTQVGWGTLWTDRNGNGNVVTNPGQGFAGANWVRDVAGNSQVSWEQGHARVGGGTVRLTPPSAAGGGGGSGYGSQPITYRTVTDTYAGTPVTISSTPRLIGQHRGVSNSTTFTTDGPKTDTKQVVIEGDWEITTTTTTWTRYRYRRDTWVTYNDYEVVTTTRTPWYRRYTTYARQGGSEWVVQTWSDPSPYEWRTAESRSNSSVPVPGTETTTDTLEASWTERSMSQSRRLAPVTAAATLQPTQAMRGDTVTLTVTTTGPVRQVVADFPNGRVQLSRLDANTWHATYLVDNEDGTYRIPVAAAGPANVAQAEVVLVVQRDRNKIIPNVLGGG